MRHRRSTHRLTQKPDHARLLKRNLVTSLLLYESVRTTRKRAKVVQPIVDHLITVAKGDVPQVAIRSINSVVTDRNASRKLMEVLRERYRTRPSGFTRIVAVGSRKGDGAQVVDLSLIDSAASVIEKQPTQPKKPTQPTKKAKSSVSSVASDSSVSS